MPSSTSHEISRILLECNSCTVDLGARRVLGGGVRLRFAQLHFMIGNGFLSSCEGGGGLWELVKNVECELVSTVKASTNNTNNFLRTLPMTRIHSNFARLFKMTYLNDSWQKRMFPVMSGHVATKVMLQKPSICLWVASKVGYSPIPTSVLYLLVLDQVRHN